MIDISTHILDTARGLPAAGVNIQLQRLEHNPWQDVALVCTNKDGRAPELAQLKDLPAATYRLRFDTASYLQTQQQPVFYPWVEIVVELSQGHYHIPLLLSPFGYSTYRGS